MCILQKTENLPVQVTLLNCSNTTLLAIRHEIFVKFEYSFFESSVVSDLPKDVALLTHIMTNVLRYIYIYVYVSTYLFLIAELGE